MAAFYFANRVRILSARIACVAEVCAVLTEQEVGLTKV